MRAVPAPPAAIRWLLAPLVALSLVAFAFPAPAQAQPPPPPAPECTSAPEFPFHHDCVEHDECYSPASYLSRKRCDDNFRSNMHDTCSTYVPTPPYSGICHGQAEIYYWAVRWHGEDHYDGQGGDGYDDDDDDDDPPPPPPPAGSSLGI